ncbi:hypothetical protein EDB19DRAFT_1905872 [Suillus lakei]|nr:hypothetical protein EDB19DRAFT_1905872 [Suillus lakei]
MTMDTHTILYHSILTTHPKRLQTTKLIYHHADADDQPLIVLGNGLTDCIYPMITAYQCLHQQPHAIPRALEHWIIRASEHYTPLPSSYTAATHIYHLVLQEHLLIGPLTLFFMLVFTFGHADTFMTSCYVPFTCLCSLPILGDHPITSHLFLDDTSDESSDDSELTDQSQPEAGASHTNEEDGNSIKEQMPATQVNSLKEFVTICMTWLGVEALTMVSDTSQISDEAFEDAI